MRPVASWSDAAGLTFLPGSTLELAWFEPSQRGEARGIPDSRGRSVPRPVVAELFLGSWWVVHPYDRLERKQ